jgi:hypothetical protein
MKQHFKIQNFLHLKQNWMILKFVENDSCFALIMLIADFKIVSKNWQKQSICMVPI